MIKALLFSLLISSTGYAKIKTERVQYKSGNVAFEGFLAYDSDIKEKRPGVMIVHNWMGITPETESKAIEVAKLGYVAFAGDIYGKDSRPKNPEEATVISGKYKSDLKLLRERANLAVAELRKQKNVDTSKIFATGYCFGGTTVLELARSGADVKGFVTFHGGLTSSNDDKNIKGQVLVLHGAIDPFVPAQAVEGFLKGMNEAKVNYQMISYSGAVHSFTEKAAGNNVALGSAYNEVADRRSWNAMKEFIAELSK